jgi:hypothetical protein
MDTFEESNAPLINQTALIPRKNTISGYIPSSKLKSEET